MDMWASRIFFSYLCKKIIIRFWVYFSGRTYAYLESLSLRADSMNIYFFEYHKYFFYKVWIISLEQSQYVRYDMILSDSQKLFFISRQEKWYE